jgi:hypothetical protein
MVQKIRFKKKPNVRLFFQESNINTTFAIAFLRNYSFGKKSGIIIWKTLRSVN